MMILLFSCEESKQLELGFEEFQSDSIIGFPHYYWDELVNSDSLFDLAFSDSTFFDKYESTYIDQFDDVKRKDEDLFFISENGKEVKIESSTDRRYLEYQLAWSYLDRPFLLFEATFRKVSTYYLFHRNSTNGIDLVGTPYFSPNDERIISISGRLEFEPKSILQIFQKEGLDYKKVFEYVDQTHDYQNVKWINDSEFLLRCRGEEELIVLKDSSTMWFENSYLRKGIIKDIP